MNCNQQNIIKLAFVLFFTILMAEEKMVVRFENPDKAIIVKFNNTEYDVAAFKPNAFLDLVVSKSKYEEILSQGFKIFKFGRDLIMAISSMAWCEVP